MAESEKPGFWGRFWKRADRTVTAQGLFDTIKNFVVFVMSSGLFMPTRGLAVEPEDGRGNAKLWSWYESLRFCPAKNVPGLMYGPYEELSAGIEEGPPLGLA